MNASKATTYGATEPAPAPAGKKWGRRDAVAAVLILASTAAAAVYVSGSGQTGLVSLAAAPASPARAADESVFRAPPASVRSSVPLHRASAGARPRAAS